MEREGLPMTVDRQQKSRLLIGIVGAVLLRTAGQGIASDSANGQRIAERWCAECHLAAPRQQQSSDAVPTFAQIAASERFDEAALAAFLANPHHSTMPNLSLSRSEIADLVAYIKLQSR
jgi:mono/diheme cytochrome c family protein